MSEQKKIVLKPKPKQIIIEQVPEEPPQITAEEQDRIDKENMECKNYRIKDSGPDEDPEPEEIEGEPTIEDYIRLIFGK